jgi:hypothetical protein
MATRPRVGTGPPTSKIASNWPLKVSMAVLRPLWKTRRTSTPSAVCG